MSSRAKRIFVLTGAGVSAESGLGTFRDRDGLWARYDPMKLATPAAFARTPREVHAFYNARRAALLQAKPNAAHQALARLETALAGKGGQLFLCTQNIDDLHERAGSRRLIHMHGEHLKAWCTACDSRPHWTAPLIDRPPCPACGARALRPDVVWFGEMPYAMDRIMAALSEADLFASVGTSGAVYPAAGFVRTARDLGARTLELVGGEESGLRFGSG